MSRIVIVILISHRHKHIDSINLLVLQRKSSGSGTGSTQLVSTTEELLGSNSSGSSLESREYGRRDSSR
jgi:hypothetical protein